MPLSSDEERRIVRLEERLESIDADRRKASIAQEERSDRLEVVERRLRDTGLVAVVLAGVLGITSAYQLPDAIEGAVVRVVEKDEGAVIEKPLNEAVTRYMQSTEGANLLDRIRADSGEARLLLSDTNAVYEKALSRFGDINSAAELETNLASLEGRVSSLEEIPESVGTLEAWQASATVEAEGVREEISHLSAFVSRVRIVTIDLDSISVDPSKDCDNPAVKGQFHYRVSVGGHVILQRSRSRSTEAGDGGRIDLGTTSSVVVTEDEFVLEFVAFDKDEGTSGADEVLGPVRLDHAVSAGWVDGWREVTVAEVGSATCEVSFRYRLREPLSLSPEL